MAWGPLRQYGTKNKRKAVRAGTRSNRERADVADAMDLCPECGSPVACPHDDEVPYPAWTGGDA